MRFLAFSLLLALAASAPAQTEPPARHAALIQIDGPIGPATSGYFEKAHRQALEGGAAVIVVRIDTPGGLDTAMRDIIKLILQSPVPVVGYVGPSGARAASAGTYILYATHVAAMAPATNLGAATPVPAAGGSWPAPGRKKDEKPEKGEDAEGAKSREAAPQDSAPPDASQQKVINDAIAYIRSLAERRGRNADWAEKAVREGASLSSDQALKEQVIDLVVDDIDKLLAAIDGRSVTTSTGPMVLETAGLRVEPIDPDWRMRFLAIITSPTIAYILMLIGIYGLLLEGYHPGAIVPGVVGAICLLLALFAFQVLPINYVGLGLILLGVVLMIAEALAPSFGALGFGGVVAFVVGSIMLMDMDVPGYSVHLGVIFGIATAAAATLGLTLFLIWRARKVPVVTGDRTLVGHVAELDEAVEREGWLWIAGERWRIRTTRPLPPGARVRIISMDGLTLLVEPENN